jgi:nucleotide-binding universal stress UspA family protein
MRERRPLGNVLVATDFSAGATRAVERAARLPISPGSALTVLHVLRAGCEPDERAEAEEALANTVAIAAESIARDGRKDVDVCPRLVEGTPFVEIVRSARHGRNELLVIGRHGERGFRDLLLGSTAERVIRKGDTSILVVASAPEAPYAQPLVAVDCSDAARRVVELAWRVADPGVQELAAIHAYDLFSVRAIRRVGVEGEELQHYRRDVQRKAEAQVESFVATCEVGVPVRVVVHEGDPRSVILDAVAQRSCDLVALGTHGRSGLAHVLLGSVAEAVIRAATCDVLVARPVGLPFKLP